MELKYLRCPLFVGAVHGVGKEKVSARAGNYI
jgi:hypothetical protein